MRDRKPRASLIDQKFGKLKVQSWAGNSRWNCICDCGKSAVVLTANLKRGNSTSCGCIRNIASSKRATTHGLSNTLAYKTWLSVRRRCRDTKCVSYASYGAKGIDIYQEWYESAEKFIAYVGQPPTSGHSLDRIDNTKGYFPGNIRWATDEQQANNKSNNVIVNFRGKTYTLSQLAKEIDEECGITKKQMLSAFEKQIYGRSKP